MIDFMQPRGGRPTSLAAADLRIASSILPATQRSPSGLSRCDLEHGARISVRSDQHQHVESLQARGEGLDILNVIGEHRDL